MTKMNCNMCITGEMEHQEFKGTHIYVCDQCPNIQFEFSFIEDAKNLLEYLEETNK